MGRHAGHLAYWSGLAGGAFMILIPECPFDTKTIWALLDDRLDHVDRHRSRYAVIVISDG